MPRLRGKIEKVGLLVKKRTTLLAGSGTKDLISTSFEKGI